MALERITLMEAYIIENLKNTGVTNHELIQVNDASIKQWEKDYENFDFTLLQALAEDEERLTSILEAGYQIKFLTFNGLINLLRLKFSKVPEQDFNQLEQGIEHLQVTEEQQATLKGMLSPNWTMITTAEAPTTISIKQAQRA